MMMPSFFLTQSDKILDMKNSQPPPHKILPCSHSKTYLVGHVPNKISKHSLYTKLSSLIINQIKLTFLCIKVQLRLSEKARLV